MLNAHCVRASFSACVSMSTCFHFSLNLLCQSKVDYTNPLYSLSLSHFVYTLLYLCERQSLKTDQNEVHELTLETQILA